MKFFLKSKANHLLESSFFPIIRFNFSLKKGRLLNNNEIRDLKYKYKRHIKNEEKKKIEKEVEDEYLKEKDQEEIYFKYANSQLKTISDMRKQGKKNNIDQTDQVDQLREDEDLSKILSIPQTNDENMNETKKIKNSSLLPNKSQSEVSNYQNEISSLINNDIHKKYNPFKDNINIVNYIKKLSSSKKNEDMYLFGTKSKGRSSPKNSSDVDLLVNQTKSSLELLSLFNDCSHILTSNLVCKFIIKYASLLIEEYILKPNSSKNEKERIVSSRKNSFSHFNTLIKNAFPLIIDGNIKDFLSIQACLYENFLSESKEINDIEIISEKYFDEVKKLQKQDFVQYKFDVNDIKNMVVILNSDEYITMSENEIKPINPDSLLRLLSVLEYLYENKLLNMFNEKSIHSLLSILYYISTVLEKYFLVYEYDNHSNTNHENETFIKTISFSLLFLQNSEYFLIKNINFLSLNEVSSIIKAYLTIINIGKMLLFNNENDKNDSTSNEEAYKDMFISTKSVLLNTFLQVLYKNKENLSSFDVINLIKSSFLKTTSRHQPKFLNNIFNIHVFDYFYIDLLLKDYKDLIIEFLKKSSFINNSSLSEYVVTILTPFIVSIMTISSISLYKNSSQTKTFIDLYISLVIKNIKNYTLPEMTVIINTILIFSSSISSKNSIFSYFDKLIKHLYMYFFSNMDILNLKGYVSNEEMSIIENDWKTKKFQQFFNENSQNEKVNDYIELYKTISHYILYALVYRNDDDLITNTTYYTCFMNLFLEFLIEKSEINTFLQLIKKRSCLSLINKIEMIELILSIKRIEKEEKSGYYLKINDFLEKEIDSKEDKAEYSIYNKESFENLIFYSKGLSPIENTLLKYVKYKKELKILLESIDFKEKIENKDFAYDQTSHEFIKLLNERYEVLSIIQPDFIEEIDSLNDEVINENEKMNLLPSIRVCFDINSLEDNLKQVKIDMIKKYLPSIFNIKIECFSFKDYQTSHESVKSYVAYNIKDI